MAPADRMPATIGEALQEVATLRALVLEHRQHQESTEALTGSLRLQLEEAQATIGDLEREVAQTREYATKWEGACRMAMQTLGAAVTAAVLQLLEAHDGRRSDSANPRLTYTLELPKAIRELALNARFVVREREGAESTTLIDATILDPLPPQEPEPVPIATRIAQAAPGDAPLTFTEPQIATFRQRFLEHARLADVDLTAEAMDALLHSLLTTPDGGVGHATAGVGHATAGVGHPATVGAEVYDTHEQQGHTDPQHPGE